jgi:major intracellular serine protease
MTKPTVTRSAIPANFRQKDFDATDPDKLPLGVRLHGAEQLRKDGLTGSGIRVAVIDSGIDDTHPGFHNKVKRGKWFREGTPLDVDDHGTHVAGTIHFMAPDAEIYDYRVFGERGIDGDLAIANSIRKAVDDKCQVINMSLRCSFPVKTAVEEAVRYASEKGVHMVCAAGNSGDGKVKTDEKYSFPARFKETISVAAVNKRKGLPVAKFSESNKQVDYSGIGRNVISLKPFGGVQRMTGTSMASPHVAGLIAALLSSSNCKNLSDEELRKLIFEKHLVDIGAKGFDKKSGDGFVTYLPGSGDNDDLSKLLDLNEEEE